MNAAVWTGLVGGRWLTRVAHPTLIAASLVLDGAVLYQIVSHTRIMSQKKKKRGGVHAILAALLCGI